MSEPDPVTRTTSSSKGGYAWVMWATGAVIVVILAVTALTGGFKNNNTRAAAAAPATTLATTTTTSSDYVSLDEYRSSINAVPAPTDGDDNYGGGSGHAVTYEITGSATEALQVSYSTEGFGISQVTSVSLPWAKKTYMSGGGYWSAGVNAQNAGSGSITCTITVDGVVRSTNSGSGPYALAQCIASGTD